MLGAGTDMSGSVVRSGANVMNNRLVWCVSATERTGGSHLVYHLEVMSPAQDGSTQLVKG